MTSTLEGGFLPPDPIGWSCQRGFTARPEVVTRELVGLNQTLVQLGLPIGQLFALELVLAEALNNVVEHAYRDQGHGRIEMDIAVWFNSIHCTLRDWGAPMPNGCLPPARRHAPDRLDMQALPEGGFGWALIRDMTRDLTYRRQGRMNRLSFVIDLDMETVPQL